MWGEFIASLLTVKPKFQKKTFKIQQSPEEGLPNVHQINLQNQSLINHINISPIDNYKLKIGVIKHRYLKNSIRQWKDKKLKQITAHQIEKLINSLTGISKSLKYFPATRICCKRGMSSQSKQHIVSPVKNRVPLLAKWSLIFRKWANNALFFCSSFFTNTSFSFEYRFSISVATSLSCTNKL